MLFRSILWKSLILAALDVFSLPASLPAQVTPAASYANDLQVGATINFASPDFGPNTLRGFGFYLTDDFALHHHVGFEASFHQLYDPDAKEGIYQRTYEIGPRYVFRFGRLKPYAKLLVGRGVFQFPPDPQHPANGPAANLAYTTFAGGFGADYRVRPSIKVRVDYELQRWGSFPPNGINPRVLSFGVAYHFH